MAAVDIKKSKNVCASVGIATSYFSGNFYQAVT